MSGINAGQLLRHVIEPTLSYMSAHTGLAMDGRSAGMMLVLIQAHETLGHRWLTQRPGGPGRGGYQQEIATHDWLWSDYLRRRQDIAGAILAMVPEGGNTADRMVYDLAYSTAMARVQLWTDPNPLPDHNDLLGMAAYWKRAWNTHKGAGTIEKFIADARLYAGSVLP